MFFRHNKSLIIVFTISIIVYLLSCFGVFDAFSAYTAKTFYNHLGYTNKWSHSFGPKWLVEIIDNFRTLGSREIVLLLSIFMYLYLKRTRENRDARKFAFTIGLGIVFLLVVKTLTSTKNELNMISVLTETLSYFPSGHAYRATILYLTLAKFSTKRSKDSFLVNSVYASASIVILLTGISLFMGSGHTVTEVIAGWSLGLCWFTFAQLFLAADHRTIFNK
jgi:undecaprenyl-diphosphatase